MGYSLFNVAPSHQPQQSLSSPPSQSPYFVPQIHSPMVTPPFSSFPLVFVSSVIHPIESECSSLDFVCVQPGTHGAATHGEPQRDVSALLAASSLSLSNQDQVKKTCRHSITLQFFLAVSEPLSLPFRHPNRISESEQSLKPLCWIWRGLFPGFEPTRKTPCWKPSPCLSAKIYDACSVTGRVEQLRRVSSLFFFFFSFFSLSQSFVICFLTVERCTE